MLQKSLYFAILFVAAASTVEGFFFSRRNPMFDHWSDLRVKIPSFYSMPRTAQEAEDEGWTKTDDCSRSLPFRGNRYVKSTDRTIKLLFTNMGRLAGMQIGIPKNQAPTGQMRRAFIEEADSFTITAYFVDPETICTNKQNSFPDMLKFQLGPYSNENFITAPMDEADVPSHDYPWVEGKCFWLMGKHYWSKKPTRAACDDTNPFFLLYNGGKLTAFGWTFYGDLDSSYFERPGVRDAERTMIEVPLCMRAPRFRGRLRTMHVYFDSPYNNFC